MTTIYIQNLKIMQSAAGGDVDRALSSIRARADHLRHTVARLEHNLAWNPASTWSKRTIFLYRHS
ncbi:hypothetical protein PHYSODRAFT_286339 [Plasmopara halstedii]|uniref:Uncharacterized protein n=1 Tax=Plasmopara halstedii TaxID=4781 RepID=A0A0P1B3C4_PLAHL|nr:hypothetical protein PHYSODRAFT_286339 [Plasmopara halstedii]CEG47988.1 hypothetical protein PHYSODRAFT_286339 [Plasmopara halstedii]|eukprot:XP_024584357.1 hypothetical protein PHYSODRAFT_286339 [Plasmopara halstedii]